MGGFSEEGQFGRWWEVSRTRSQQFLSEIVQDIIERGTSSSLTRADTKKHLCHVDASVSSFCILHRLLATVRVPFFLWSNRGRVHGA